MTARAREDDDPFDVLPVQLLIDSTLWWKRVVAGAQRWFDGVYSLSDALADADSVLITATTASVRGATAWLSQGEAPLEPLPSGWHAEMKVYPDLRRKGPLTLRTKGLKAVGLPGAIVVPPENVVFTPKVLPLEQDTFAVDVSFRGVVVPAAVFTGDVTAHEVRGRVTDPIFANNLDHGPVPGPKESPRP